MAGTYSWPDGAASIPLDRNDFAGGHGIDYAPAIIGVEVWSPALGASKPERPVERGNPIKVDGQFDGPRSAGDAPDESPLFEPDQHGIH